MKKKTKCYLGFHDWLEWKRVLDDLVIRYCARADCKGVESLRL
jgi:hypothetical protein